MPASWVSPALVEALTQRAPGWAALRPALDMAAVINDDTFYNSEVFSLHRIYRKLGATSRRRWPRRCTGSRVCLQ